uniref:Globin n=1 Tax=Eucampia antarctica TaxID=49252 RepID=A0A7S2WRL1_9STRA|mmetsp:Transcript_9928/g.9611  ORF Transcript_9928/g.9611 Transcript_9928/m.9611 type:complete len:177 (+) Transcript_9928:141-671(+)
MSKQQLQDYAFKYSGVTYEESLEAINIKPSIYERIGDKGFMKLSELFYERVFNDDDAAWFLNIFSSSTKNEAVDNQFRFFVQTFGGPDLYRQKKGKYTRLAGRHANYNIGTNAANRWVMHMDNAIDEHKELKEDIECRQLLKKYFTYTAHYIVTAMTYMRSDQLSGGTKIDSGRVW